MRKLISISMILILVLSLTGCAMFGSDVTRFEGYLIGVGFNIHFYDNQGSNILNVYGNKVSVNTNTVEVLSIDEEGNESITKENTSVITITADGNNIEQTGNTVIFAEKGLEPLCNFDMPTDVETSGGTITSIDRVINDYKNMFGTPKTLVISSQLGVPICAYGGEDVYWEIPADLPKTTILHVDGKALYIHRANYILFDTEMIK